MDRPMIARPQIGKARRAIRRGRSLPTTIAFSGCVTLATAVLLLGCSGPRVAPAPAPSVAGSELGSDLDVRQPTERRPSAVTASSTAALARATSGAAVPATTTPARLPWRFNGIDGQIVVTPNYLLHTTMTNERLVAQLAILMEAALEHYVTALGELPRPQSPMSSFIFERRSEWADHTRDLLGPAAGPYLSLGRGGYTTGAESVLFNIGREDTFTIAVHEGWHQYTQQVFRDQLPVWLEEGIATYMEGNRFRRDAEGPVFLPWRNFERYGELRDAVRTNRLIPLAELVEGSPQRFLERGRGSLLTYYAQVWALVHFLLEGQEAAHRSALLEIVDDAAHGRLVRRLVESDVVPRGAGRRLVNQGRHGRLLLEEYVSRDLDELSREYEAFVRQIVSSGSANRIWRGQSPID